MRTTFGKKILPVFLSLLLLIDAVPYTASTVHAAGISAEQTELTVNQSVVAFGGYEWWVIGDADSGVYPQADSATLLAKTLQDEWRNVEFRTGSGSSFADSSQYSGDNWYYANNPSSMKSWTTPNEYAGSTLQQKMESIAGGFPEAEQYLINSRSFTGGGTYQNPSADGIAGQGLSNQKVWSLSSDEWTTIANNTVRSYGDYWWLRSPYSHDGYEARQGHPSGGTMYLLPVDLALAAVRPAFNLNLKSVLFTSSAAAGGKSSATVGSNLIGAEAPTGTVKFTMKDTSQTLTVGSITSNGRTLQGTYSGATTGENQYVSCVLTDNTGDVKYYGKLADSSGAASGTFSIPLSGVADGSYTLKIFSEQANRDLYTDFCSEPVTMTLTVSDANGIVSGFSGTIHSHIWSTEWRSDETAHWHDCTVENCPTANKSDKGEYEEHAYDQEVVSNTYKAEEASCTDAATYYKSCVCGKKGTKTFTAGTALGHNKEGNIVHKDATCTEDGVVGGTYCTRCNEGKAAAEAVIPALRHEYGNWKSNGDNTHSRTCTRNGCTEKQTENCTGDTATCQKKAVCTECGTEYGEKDLSNHTGTESWVQAETTHRKVYSCCNTPISEATDHVWKNGTCTVCQYPCKHTGGKATCTQKAVCEICNSQYGEINPNNHKPSSEWEWKNDRHYHICENGCGTPINEQDCSGGRATCTDKALCDVCDHTYGDYGNHIHTENKPETPAGCEAVGYTAGVYCTDCGKWVSGHEEIPAKGHGELKTEKTKKATCTAEGYTGDKVCTVCDEVIEKGKAIQKLAHSYKDGKCTVCGEADPDYVPAPQENQDKTDETTSSQNRDKTNETTDSQNRDKTDKTTGSQNQGNTNSLQTGDSSDLTLWLAVLLATGVGIVSTTVYGRRKRKHSK